MLLPKNWGCTKTHQQGNEKEDSLPDVGFVLKLCELIDSEFVTPDWLIRGEGFPPPPAYSLAHEEFRQNLKGFSDLDKAIKATAGLSISPQDLVEYIKGNHLPSDEELVELSSRFHYSDESLLSMRKHENRCNDQEGGGSKARLYSAKILKKVLLATEDVLIKKDLHPITDKKAELISILYEELYDTKLSENEIENRIMRLSKLILSE